MMTDTDVKHSMKTSEWKNRGSWMTDIQKNESI